MNVIEKLLLRIRQKGLSRTLGALGKRYVFAHRELLWMERDLVTPIGPNKLRPCEGLRRVDITEDNAKAFGKYFGDRVGTMAELAAEGHTGHMYLDQDGHTVGFVWASARDYYDRHFYRCTFPVQPGEYFQFGAEIARPYFGTSLTVDAQTALWQVMDAKGFKKVVDICDNANIQALKMHVRLGYKEQGRITHVYDLFGHWRFFRETRYSESRLEALRKPERPAVTAPAQA